MRTVLISGAGIAGPALAYWLARHGFRPTVVERAGALREGGQAVDFRGGPQMRVLGEMGLLPAIRAAQTGMGAITIVNAKGRRLSSLPAEAFSGDVEILRGDLCRILHEATRETAEYVFGDSVATLADTGDGVRVTFERAGPRTFDLVVGADGTHSTVRALAFAATPATIRPMGFHSAVFTAAHAYGLDRTGLMYSVPGRSATILGGAATDMPAKVMLDFAAPPPAVDHRDVEAQRALVAGAFEGLGWHVPSLLEAMWRAPDFYFDSAAQVVMDRYATGRVALLGDAGFGPGPGGMGSGLAVVGAYVLAGELTAAGGDHESAFAAYERRLRPYADVCAGQARGGEGFLVPRRRSQIWMRNQTMRVLTRLPGKGLIRKLTAKAANAIDLPDYRPYGLSRTG